MEATVDSEFSKASEFAKFELIVEGKSLFVNASHLAQISPYFAALCFEDFKEKADQKATIADETFKDVLTLLCAIFSTNTETSDAGPISPASFAVIYRLADKFQLKSVTVQCETLVLCDQFNYTPVEEPVLLQMLKSSALVGNINKDLLAKLISRAATFDYNVLIKHKMYELSGALVACLFHANASAKPVQEYDDDDEEDEDDDEGRCGSDNYGLRWYCPSCGKRNGAWNSECCQYSFSFSLTAPRKHNLTKIQRVPTVEIKQALLEL